jgi:hypothetical protein
MPTVDEIERHLTAVVLNLEQKKESYQSQCVVNRRHMEEVVASLARLQDQFVEISTQYKFYQNLRKYIENLASMLDVKVRGSECHFFFERETQV